MSYIIRGIDSAPFEHLFGLSDQELQQHGAKRYIVDADNAYPDRVSVTDLAIGDTALLVNYEHLPTSGPYRSQHAIFVAERSAQASIFSNSIPDALKNRLLSVRSFDHDCFMLDAEVLEGVELARWIEAALAHSAVAFIQVHTARRGCFMAQLTRD